MIKPEYQQDGEQILVQIAPSDIDFFNKLLEGYDNMAIVTTIDAKLGKLALWVTQHTKKDTLGILKCLPIPVKFITQE